MTKIKKQLRAEAVERLKMLDEYGGGSFEYAILGSDKIAWRYMDKRDALIDLLTDDDSTTQEDDSTTELVSDEADSREKLETDVLEMVKKGFITYETLIEWLDRQAAITEREHPGLTISDDESLINWRGRNYLPQSRALNAERERDEFSLKLKHEMELNRDNRNAHDLEQIAELTAERDELKERADYNSHGWAKANIGWAEANAEAEKWQMKCDEYRSKFGKCIDYADAIHALMDDEGLA